MAEVAIGDSLASKLRHDAGQHLAQIVISCLFFEWLTHQMKIWIEALLPRCKSFSPVEKDMLIARYFSDVQMTWNFESRIFYLLLVFVFRVSSLVHSVIVFPLSVYCLLFDEASRNDVIGYAAEFDFFMAYINIDVIAHSRWRCTLAYTDDFSGTGISIGEGPNNWPAYW